MEEQKKLEFAENIYQKIDYHRKIISLLGGEAAVSSTKENKLQFLLQCERLIKQLGDDYCLLTQLYCVKTTENNIALRTLSVDIFKEASKLSDCLSEFRCETEADGTLDLYKPVILQIYKTISGTSTKVTLATAHNDGKSNVESNA